MAATARSQVLDEHRPSAIERPQRLALSTRTVQRQHVVASKCLSKRVLLGQRLQLADQLAMSAHGQIGFDPSFERCQTELLEPGDLCRKRPSVLNIGVRIPTPE